MCTGIFIFGPRPVLALNFDYNPRISYRLALERKTSFSLLARFPGRQGRPLGVTRFGSSANIQLAPYIESAEHDPNLPDRTDARYLVKGVLRGSLRVSEVPEFLENHKMMYAPDNTGIHCLCTDKSGEMYLVTPGGEGPGYLTREEFPDGFALFTNFHLYRRLPVNREMKWITCERYRTAYEMLLEDRDGTDRLFEILEATKIADGKLPTVLSLVARLDTGEIDFTLGGNFEKRYRFSFKDEMVRPGLGCSFEPQRLTHKGIELEALRRW